MKKLILTGACLLAGAAAFNALAKGKFKADDFIEEASAKGLAEIAMAKIALNKSSSASVKEFAQTMISDHTAANDELKAIARMKNLEIADDSTLMQKAKALILKQSDGTYFDVAYAKNQVSAHEKAIMLFKDASHTQDSEIKAFADKTLPKLERHLQLARDLVATTKMDERVSKHNGSLMNRGGTPANNIDVEARQDAQESNTNEHNTRPV